MNDFDRDMKEALDSASGFNADRARAAQEEVYASFQKKLMRSERRLWVLLYPLVAVLVYAMQGFALHATTPKGWVGYGMAILTVFVIAIQKTLLQAVTATQLVAMKEIKQLRLAVSGGAVPHDEAAAKPLCGLQRREQAVWFCGLCAVMMLVSAVGSLSNRQDDTWRLKSQGVIEAHSVVTLSRVPHAIAPLCSIASPVDGAVLQSAALNGQPVTFSSYKGRYTVQLPSRVGRIRDKIELVWSFPLTAMKDGEELRAPLRSVMPVHAYSLTLHVADDCGYAATDQGWRFGKKPAELKDEAAARRVLKLYWTSRDNACEDFGSCGVPLTRR